MPKPHPARPEAGAERTAPDGTERFPPSLRHNGVNGGAVRGRAARAGGGRLSSADR
ncbi:hypothetical protein GA0115252_10996, partial [Streptomyces sp. DfronAA-171]